MAGVEDLNQIDASNTVLLDGGWPEGMNRSDVNNQGRHLSGALRRWYENAEWVDLLNESGDDFTVARVDVDKFRVTDAGGTDATSKFTMPDSIVPATGMSVKVTGTGTPTIAFGTVKTIGTYGAPNLDITLENIVDVTYTTSAIPSGSVTKIECYINRRIRQTAFSPIGVTRGEEPPEIPSIDLLGSEAILNGGHDPEGDDTPGINADLLDGKHYTDILSDIGFSGGQSLINGDMGVWQRGTTIDVTTPHPNTDGLFCADRWVFLCEANDVFEISRTRTNVPNGFRNAMRLLSITGAGPSGGTQKFGIVQFLPRDITARYLLSGKACLSWYMARDADDAFSKVRGAILEWTGADDDAVERDVVATWNAEGTKPSLATGWAYAVDPDADLVPTSSWVRQSGGATLEDVTIDASTKNLAAFVWCEDKTYNVGDELFLDGVQLEPGSVTTAYQHRSLSEEVADCERFFCKTYDLDTKPGTSEDAGALIHPASRFFNAGASELVLPWDFPARMRDDPTVVPYSPDTGNANVVEGATDGDLDTSSVNPGEGRANLLVTENPSAKQDVAGHATADAEMGV